MNRFIIIGLLLIISLTPTNVFAKSDSKSLTFTLTIPPLLTMEQTDFEKLPTQKEQQKPREITSEKDKGLITTFEKTTKNGQEILLKTITVK